MHWYDGVWWGHMGWMMVLWAIGGALLLLVAAYVVREIAGRTGRPGPGGRAEQEDRAERILRERYARGEIDEQELHRRMDELRSGA